MHRNLIHYIYNLLSVIYKINFVNADSGNMGWGGSVGVKEGGGIQWTNIISIFIIMEPNGNVHNLSKTAEAQKNPHMCSTNKQKAFMFKIK